MRTKRMSNGGPTLRGRAKLSGGLGVSGEVRDPGLLSHYVAYMKAALALIRKHEIERRERPNALWLVIRLFEPLKELPELQGLHTHVVSSYLGESVLARAADGQVDAAKADPHWFMNFYMMPVLTAYIGPDLLLGFDERRARLVYADLESSLGATQEVYSIMAPLQHFEGPDEEIRLDAKMVLRKLTQDDMQYLRCPDEFGGMVERRDALSMRFCLAASLVTEKGAVTKLSEVRGPVMRVVTALRLLKSGQVGVPVVIQRLREPAFGLAGGTFSVSGAPAALGPSYTLLLEESKQLIVTCRALAKAASAKHLRVPLRRFNQAYERDRAEDRLIDYWVALEALFSPPGSGELTYRIALRAAYFIASLPEEREQIFTALRDHYGTRSDVVHGRKPKRDVKIAAGAVEDYLRRALKKIVSDPGSFRPDELDLVVARGQFQQGAG